MFDLGEGAWPAGDVRSVQPGRWLGLKVRVVSADTERWADFAQDLTEETRCFVVTLGY
jgi:hypothetical protein